MGVILVQPRGGRRVRRGAVEQEPRPRAELERREARVRRRAEGERVGARQVRAGRADAAAVADDEPRPVAVRPQRRRPRRPRAPRTPSTAPRRAPCAAPPRQLVRPVALGVDLGGRPAAPRADVDLAPRGVVRGRARGRAAPRSRAPGPGRSSAPARAGCPSRATAGASARACARPVSDSGGSSCPCRRDAAFQVDSPWRTRTSSGTQNAPRRVNTAGIVLSRIVRSSPTDQRSR